MGHQRLGTLPRSKLWRDVVQLIEHRAEVEAIAAAASHAAEQSMIDAAGDVAVQYAFYLLAKIPLAAQEHDFEAVLRGHGIPVQNGPMLTDIISGLMTAIDVRTMQASSRSDYGELAQLSAAEAMQAVIGEEAELFGLNTHVDLPAIRSLSGNHSARADAKQRWKCQRPTRGCPRSACFGSGSTERLICIAQHNSSQSFEVVRATDRSHLRVELLG